MSWNIPPVRVVVSSAFLALPASLFAQAGFDGASLTLVPAHRAAPTAAGSGSSILSIGFSSFVPASSAVTYDQDPSNESYWFQTSGTAASWTARLSLPTGAVVDSIELDACHSSATGFLGFGMSTSPAGAKGTTNVTTVAGTGTTGCGLFPVTPSNPPLVIDNAAFNYWLFLGWFLDFSSADEVAGMRVHYHLQVSPDPAVATFTDVPVGHPQHRFVEALVAAGVTAGCGGGQYCPDNPVTRGQMAVFLSVALGLNWPN